MIGRAGIFVLATAVLATAALAAAATDPVAAIIDQARGTPVEIFADVVFHLLDTEQIAPKDRVPLLEEVFLRADEARQPLATRPTSRLPVSPILHLDALFIKCRAVQALLAIDGQRARALFSQIAPPRIPKPDCKDSVVSDPTVYFEALGTVATKAPFTAQEQKKKVPLWMMADAVSGIQTSLEIIAAARGLSSLIHSEDEAMAMSGAFATALGIDDSNRNFTAAAESSLVDAILVSAGRFTSLGVPPQTMLAALRGYLVRHLTASRCEDSADAAYSASVSLFNSSLAGQTVVPPISDDESKPAKVEGKADRIPPPDLKDFVKLAKDVNAVVAGALLEEDSKAYGAMAARLSPSGSQPPAVSEVLAHLREWKGSDGQDIVDVFRRKAALYFNLLNVQAQPEAKPRDSGLRQSILSGLIATLEDRAVLDASPTDWLSEVRHLDRATEHYNAARDREAIKDFVPTDVTQAMIGSNLSALALYGRLAIFEYPPPSRLPPNRLF